MFEKLDSLLKRYNELHALMADPNVAGNPDSYQKLAKEVSSLEDAVKKYTEYRKVLAELEGAGHLLEKETHEELVEMAKMEIVELEKKESGLRAELEEMMLEEDPDANKDVILEIRAGTGGAEASLFAGDLFRMYSKYAAKNNWKVEIIDNHVAEAGGFKEVIFAVKGAGVYKKLKYEKGVHRVQRVPATEASGRIHTSAVTVAVLAEAEDVEVHINPQDIRLDVFRASGAGGQGVNKIESAVRITHISSGMVVTCQDERSQNKNKEKAMRVLRARLLEHIRKEQELKVAKDRRIQVGSGDRSEKIRTYNFPDRRVTDHRIGFTIHDLPNVMEGDMDKIIEALIQAERKLKLGKPGA
ncbi:MAG: peptide chain release factor 1 [Candidatus Omnitrophica bacterium CG22_combo_CG10-13_8_21_14_all_43_16]|nr:MAG: peptide chain release factor 1 [Candidatus Omnitrophica bacterium CG22_combo_CG10-13_8_21_14_all_43_16]